MSKLNCHCGNQISNVVFPSEYTGLIISSKAEDDFEEVTSLTMDDIRYGGRDIWECPECGRLAVNYPKINSNTVKWYKPEDNIKGDIMKFHQE